MKAARPYPKIIITPKGEAALTGGHPWVYEGEVTAVMRRCLTDEEQRIILLHVIWGYKHREIAELLDIPTGSVTSKYKRAVDKIKTNLKKEA